MSGSKRVCAMAVLVLALTACQGSDGGGTQPPASSSSQQASEASAVSPLKVEGSVVMTAGGPRRLEWLYSIDDAGSEWTCVGYGPMTVGSQVVVLDGQGATVGIGEILGPGAVLNQAAVFGNRNIEAVCAFPFAAEQVQPGLGFYTFRAGEFTSQVIAEADLQAPVDWEPVEGS